MGGSSTGSKEALITSLFGRAGNFTTSLDDFHAGIASCPDRRLVEEHRNILLDSGFGVDATIQERVRCLLRAVVKTKTGSTRHYPVEPRAQTLRETAYSIDHSDGKGGVGMTHGPSLTEADMLDIAPHHPNSEIWRFNPDGTDTRLRVWKTNYWQKA